MASDQKKTQRVRFLMPLKESIARKIKQPSAITRGIFVGIHLKSTFSFRLSGKSPNPGFAGFHPPPPLDAGLRRHDGTSLRLKKRDFNHPERDINLATCRDGANRRS